MKKRILLFCLIIIFSSGFSSCKSGVDNKFVGPYSGVGANNGQVLDNGPVKGGIIRLFSTTPDTLNPVLTNNFYVQDFSMLIFESIVKLDRSQKPIPGLADKWEVSSDGLTWTFHIRDGVLWHDNEPLTSYDVEFTLEMINNSNLSINPIYRNITQNIATYAAIDRSTFKIVLKTPNSFTAELMTFPILPKHYFLGEDLSKTPKNMSPIGTGPYKFEAYKTNSDVILVRNENWWNSKNKGKDTPYTPYIDKVDIRVFANRKDAIAAFQTKDVDVISLEKDESNRYNGRQDLLVKKYPNRNFEFIALNSSRAPLNNKIVRQAIAHALDKAKLINEILPGEAIASDIPVIPDTWLYDSSILYYSPDGALAKEILSQNNISTPINLEMLVNNDNEKRLLIAQKISEQLKEVGINIHIKSVSWDTEIKQIKSRKYDLALIGVNTPATPDISFMYSSSEIQGGMNISGYSNASVDGYLSQMITEIDRDRKKGIFMNTREIINEEIPYIGLYFYYNEIVCNKKIRGEINPSLWSKYDTLPNWYIP